MAELRDILQKSDAMKTAWITYQAFPYANAYSVALKKFVETKGAQEKLQKKREQLAILALTICSGGLLTHVFAQTTWKAVLASQALNVICKNNMDEAFNTAHFIADNKVANFIVGELWNAGARFIDQKTKTLLAQTPSNFPSTQKWQTETIALTSLMGFVNECYLKVSAGG